MVSAGLEPSHHARLRVGYDDQVFTMQRRGGISRYFVELINEFADPALDVSVRRGWRWTNNQHAIESGLGTPLPMPGGSRGAVIRAANRLIAGSVDVDIEHPTYYRAEYLGRRSAKPMIVTVYDMTPELYPDLFRLGNPHGAKREFVERADMILCISESTRRDLLRVFGSVTAPTVVTHLGVSPRFRVGAQPPSWCPDRYLLFVGRRDGYKDFRVALDAFAELGPRHAALALLAVGGGAFTAEEMACISRLGLAGRVIQHGVSDDDLPGVFNAATVFVFPSRHEGFGLPTLEALACGTPAVIANSSSHPEAGGDAALYFPPGDSSALAQQLERFLEDGATRRDASARGLSHASKFTWRHTALATATAYHEASRRG